MLHGPAISQTDCRKTGPCQLPYDNNYNYYNNYNNNSQAISANIYGQLL